MEECDCREILQQLDKKLFGIEQQAKVLNSLISNFAVSHAGDSVILIGPRSSGKRSTVEKVLAEYVEMFDVVTIDGLFHNGMTGLRILDDPDIELEKPTVIFITDFEQFVERSNQILLYKTLNATRCKPVFAIFSSSRQDCIDLLEKRVKSRLSNTRVSFAPSDVTFDKFLDAFKYFLSFTELKSGHRFSDHDRTIKEFVNTKAVQHDLKRFYEERRSYSSLKQLCMIFLSFLMADNRSISDKSSVPVFSSALSTISARTDPMKEIVDGLTLRQLCLLICCVRLARNNYQKEFSFRRVIEGYRKFTNNYLNALAVKDDMILYKELDFLCDLHVLHSCMVYGQHDYRRISLHDGDERTYLRILAYIYLSVNRRWWSNESSAEANLSALKVDCDLVLECLHNYKPLPAAISYWLDEIEK